MKSNESEQQREKRKDKREVPKPGFGDKKLVGEDRPST